MTTAFWENLRIHLTGAALHSLAYLSALVCALALRNRCPRAATLAAVGCAMLFLNVPLGAFSSAYLMSLHQSSAITLAQCGVYLAIAGIARSLLQATGFGLVFAAVFVGRGKPPASLAPPPVPPRA